MENRHRSSNETVQDLRKEIDGLKTRVRSVELESLQMSRTIQAAEISDAPATSDQTSLSQ